MSQQNIYPVPSEIAAAARVDAAGYASMYQRSIEEPEAFWAEMAAEHIQWMREPEKVWSWDYDADIEISWFADGELNICENCVDRHAESDGERIAIIWESDSGEETRRISYAELKAMVCRMANVLRERGVSKGDRVCIYMPMIPEAAVAALACARIGAIHSVVFGGFSPRAIADRILDSDCRVVITADEGLRAGKRVPLKQNVETALQETPNVHTCLVVRHTGGEVPWTAGRDIWLHDAERDLAASMDDPDHCPPEQMLAEDPLFILYTSGSTGKPKGVVHTSAGYLLWTMLTFQYTFDYRPGEVFWCAADVGWITGHSYIIYGPLASGATQLMYEGVPNYPDAGRLWQMIDRYQVNLFYTAPTAIRALIGAGDSFLEAGTRESLRVLGTVGEPINPEAWEWYYHKVGGGRCPIVDTWWQTETGGHMLTPLPGVTALKPGAATNPFFGIVPVLLDKDGEEVEGPAEGEEYVEGALCIKQPWPGQMRTVWG